MFVTGYSLITALGLNNEENEHQLSCETNHFEPYKLENINIPIAKIRCNPSEDRALVFAEKAIQDALKNARIDTLDRNKDILMIGCTKGMAQNTKDSFLKNKDYQEFSKNISSNRINQLISQKLKIPFVPLPNAACATSGQALKKAEQLLLNEPNKRIILCMTEASLTKEFISGFYKLGVLSKQKSGCSPFQTKADGFTMGEGAAAVVLQSIPTATCHFQIHSTQLANEVNSFLEFSNGCSFVFDQIQLACQKNKISLKDLQFVHLHGTGTQANDQMEINLSKALIGLNPMLKFASTKHLTGHLLGSSGLIELVISFLLSQNKTDLSLHPVCKQLPDAEKNTQKKTTSPYFANLSYGLGSTISIMLAKKLKNAQPS